MQRKKQSWASRFIDGLGTGALIGAVGVGAVLLVTALFALSLAFTTLIVIAVWNWCGVHSLFNAGELSFLQAVGVSGAIVILKGVFSSNVQITKS